MTCSSQRVSFPNTAVVTTALRPTTAVGMGKTIMISALIQTSRLSNEEMEQIEPVQARTRQLRIDKAFRPGNRQPCRNLPPSATLIVAPTSLLGQWAEEIQRSSKPGTLDVTIWHGQNRLDLGALVEGDDGDKIPKVVVTSYGTLASEHAKAYKSPVFDSKCLAKTSLS